MKGRTVYPAPSFQPPETCTEHAECLAGQASNAEMCRAAQAHYDKISTAAHEWHSAIPKAIDAYHADPERSRLEREVIEAAKAELLADDEYDKHVIAANYKRSIETRLRRRDAVRSLIEFESNQQQVKK